MWEERAGSSMQTGCVGDGWSRCHRLSLRCLSWSYQKLRGDRKCLLEMGMVRAVSSCSNSKNFPEGKFFFLIKQAALDCEVLWRWWWWGLYMNTNELQLAWGLLLTLFGIHEWTTGFLPEHS